MKSVHLIIPDLFLPQQYAAEVTNDLALPFLQKLLARATTAPLAARSAEAALCEAFGVAAQHDMPIAPISAAFDGLAAGCWLRADPVHLRLQRDQMLLSQTPVSDEEAGQFCASLNGHFAGQGIEFFAPDPQRWYVRLASLPDMQTTPLSEVIGGNVRGALPKGTDGQRWHQLFNEIQMLLFSHPLNDARESRGELPVNSLWLWGGGDTVRLERRYESACSDEVLTEMFAAAAGVPYVRAGRWQAREGRGLVFYGALRSALHSGDLHGWREALQRLETDHAQPMWQALRAGKLASLQLDVLAGENSRRAVIGRPETWRFWRPGKRLATYSMV